MNEKTFELLKHSVCIDPENIKGYYASIDGLVLLNKDWKEYIIPMSLQAAIENVWFLEKKNALPHGLLIDKRDFCESDKVK